MKTIHKSAFTVRCPRLALGVVLLAITGGSAHAQLGDGLLSYWDFEDNFEDSAASYGADSTVADDGTGGSAVVFSSDGPLGTYGDFERTGLGTENLVVVGDSADVNAAGESLTISAWFRVDGLNQGWQSIISHGEGADYRIARRADEQGLGYAGGVGDIPGANISPNVDDGEWHHVIAITEAGVNARLWVDGNLIATSAGAANIADNGAGVLYIGGNPQGNAGDANANQYRPWNGGIDDVALWNRPLTEDEIRELYLAGNSGISLGNHLNPQDTDNDGLPDAWESANGLDANDDGTTNINNGPLGDPDNDGSRNTIILPIHRMTIATMISRSMVPKPLMEPIRITRIATVTDFWTVMRPIPGSTFQPPIPGPTRTFLILISIPTATVFSMFGK